MADRENDKIKNMKDRATLRYLFALTLYGTIGLFLHFIVYSSEFVVLCRGVFGSLFIFTALMLRKEKIDVDAIKKNLLTMIISGICLGFNWVCLFEGYRYGMAVASLCNYMAPIIVVVITAVFYKERINVKQVMCVIVAFTGMILLTGIFEAEDITDLRSAIYGSLAALGFVVLVLCNRRLKDIKALEKTLIQLIFSAIIVFPYVYFNSGFPKQFDLLSVIFVMILGFVHTGLAYIFYFTSIETLPAHSLAVLGCLEPVMNLLIGGLIFREKISLAGIIGAALILLASVGNEVFADRRQ